MRDTPAIIAYGINIAWSWFYCIMVAFSTTSRDTGALAVAAIYATIITRAIWTHCPFNLFCWWYLGYHRELRWVAPRFFDVKHKVVVVGGQMVATYLVLVWVIYGVIAPSTPDEEEKGFSSLWVCVGLVSGCCLTILQHLMRRYWFVKKNSTYQQAPSLHQPYD